MKDLIVQEGDPTLRTVASPVPKKDFGSKKLQETIAKMKKALAKEEFGVAIAAPQVGESIRLFVVAGRVFKEEGDEKTSPDRVYINPELSRLSRKKVEMTEGCLSVRHKYGSVMRHEKATLKALDEKGQAQSINASGLLAHIFQHECDHLDGILYVDKAVTLEEDKDWEKLGKK